MPLLKPCQSSLSANIISNIIISAFSLIAKVTLITSFPKKFDKFRVCAFGKVNVSQDLPYGVIIQKK